MLKKTTSTLVWSFTCLLVVIIVAVVVYAYNREVVEPQAPPKKLPDVEVITVQHREYHETLLLPARLEADRVAGVSPEIDGVLAQWLVAEGHEVAQGQPVAGLDTEVIDTGLKELQASLHTAGKNAQLARIGKESADVGLANARNQARRQEIALTAAQFDLNLARIEFQRINYLVQKKVMDKAQLDTAQNALRQAELVVAQAQEALKSAHLGVRNAEVQVKSAQANLELTSARIDELKAAIVTLEVRRKKTLLKAPISGKIEEHLVETGEVVKPGMPLAQIYDLRHMRAIVNVPDRYVAFLDAENSAVKILLQMDMPGARQKIRTQLIIPGPPKLTGGKGRNITLDAKIVRIAQASDPKSNTFKVELRLPNPGGALRQGIIAQGRIEYLYYPQAIVIPVKAVQVTDEGPRVLIVEREKDAQLVRIKDIEPVSVREDQLLISKGLEAGDRLIIAGWKGLVAGEEVNVLVADGVFKTSRLNALPGVAGHP